MWISIDGLRHDYVDRARTPTLDRLSREGAFTRALIPVFPSLTFPSHVSQVTGAPPSRHGVPANTFYDSADRNTYRYPPYSSLLQAEPIWATATRQGVRVAVQDWPMGHAQAGEHAAAYFGARFDSRLRDRQRLEGLLDVWEADEHEEPLRLLIGWIGQPDRVGHSHGPDSDEVLLAVSQTDELLDWFLDRAQSLWRRGAQADDRLYVILSTDHGMSRVTTLVNPHRVVGLSRETPGLVVTTSGNVGHFHVDQIEDADEREAMIQRIIDAAQSTDFLRGWRREDLPSRWNYAHPTRTGDVVIVLDAGHTFSSRPQTPTAPVENFGGPVGMHGYDVATDADMLGYTVVWRTPSPWGGVEIEQIHSLQLHATVARMLGIAPARGAMPEPIDLPWAMTPTEAIPSGTGEASGPAGR